MTNAKTLEAMLASPPDREELVVHLFFRDGGQFGEIYRDGESYWIDVYTDGGAALKFKADELLSVMSLSLAELRQRHSPVL
jgi:hypothetical protein